MKKIFTILGLLIAFTIHAQNWSPILTNEKMNYQHSDSAYITNTIWVDSVEIDNNDSLFYLNRIVKDIPNNQEIVLRNQPQFFSTSIIQQESGNYYFASPFNYFIPTLASIGDTWNFANSISAEVTNITEDNILGVQDSAKTISLSDGNEIQLSKNFGIIKFPDFENGGYYELVGVQDTDFGEQVIDFWDIFDFEVGDVFEYSEYAGNPEGNGVIIRKITITSKSTNTNSYSYDYDGIYYCFYGCSDSYTYSGNFTFVDSLKPLTNLFNRQIAVIPYSSSGYGTNRVLAISKTYKDLETDIVYKECGIKEDEAGFETYQSDLFYEFDLLGDTIYRYNHVDLLSMPCGIKGIGYGNAIGETFNFGGCFEYWSDESLRGHIKDGDTVGIITPDSLLLTTVGSIEPKQNEVSVFPNPASEIVNISLPSDVFEINTIFELRNIHGLIVKEILISENEGQVDVSQISQGIYFYSISSQNRIIQSGKLVVQ